MLPNSLLVFCPFVPTLTPTALAPWHDCISLTHPVRRCSDTALSPPGSTATQVKQSIHLLLSVLSCCTQRGATADAGPPQRCSVEPAIRFCVGSRAGCHACLQCSQVAPGAAGPPPVVFVPSVGGKVPAPQESAGRAGKEERWEASFCLGWEQSP